MAENVLNLPRAAGAGRPTVAASPAARLSRALALLGGRLARLLDGLSPGAHGARDGQAAAADTGAADTLAGSRAFLDAMADAWAAGPGVDSGLPAGHGAGLDRSPAGPPQAIDRLTWGLGLTATELELMLLAAMADEHEGYASVLRALNPRGEARPVVGLAAQLLCADAAGREALRAALLGGAACRHGVLALAGDGGLYEQALVLAPGLWPVLGGVDVWPPELQPLAPDGLGAGLDDWLASTPVRRAALALLDDAPRVIVVSAESEDIALERAAALCRHAGVRHAALAPPAPAHLSLARVHALARGAVLLLRAGGGEGGAAAGGPPVSGGTAAGADGFPGVLVWCTRRGSTPPRSTAPVLHLVAEPLGAAARQTLWRAVLPELAAQAPTLALRYLVEPAAAARIAADARSRAALDGRAPDLDSVADSVRARAQAQGAPGLDVVRPKAHWDQLVLAPARKAQLAEALQRLAHQGQVLDAWKFLDGRAGARGVRLLLSGPPGTGKSLAAEVLAGTLGVDLLVVDIARLVSKWIGETEKHLAAVFDAAEGAQAVLLFDEADALFGKRTDVADAHDRYANLETAYLLSRLERFEGLAMLSTNLKQNIDAAFLRRIEFVIDFELPAQAEREALWRCHLPAAAPLAADVRLVELAMLYPISGGLIRNAAVAAAFRAAAAGSAITRELLVTAVAREYEKSGKSFPGVPAGMTPL